MSSYRIKPAIVWPGGKSRLLKHILPRITPHRCYVEPFAGGIAVLLAKPRSTIEVLNDANGDLVTFYRCVRFHRDPLLTELQFVLNSRQEFTDFAQQPGLTDIQRAARWFYRNRNCFRGANLETFGTGPTPGAAAGSREARMRAIEEVSLRLDRTTIENLDWQRCVDLYDREETFFFFDPPYVGGNSGQYGAWTNSDVLQLRERIDRLRGRWLLTLNDTPDIRKIFNDCEIVSIDRARGIHGGRYRELIIGPACDSDRTAGGSCSHRVSKGSGRPPGRA